MSANVVSFACEFPNDNPALHAGVLWVCLEPTGAPIGERSHASCAELPEVRVVAIAPVAAIVPEPPESPATSAEPEPVPPTLVAEAVPAIEDASIDHGIIEDVVTMEEVVIVEDLEPFQDAAVEGAAEDLDDPAPATEPESSVVPAFEEIAASDAPADIRTSALPPAPDDPFMVLVCTLADVAIGAGSPHVAALLPGLLFDGRVPEPLDPASDATLRSGGLWDGTEIDAAFVATAHAWRGILRGTSDDFDACGAAMLDEWASELLARLLEEKAAAPRLRQELRSRGVAAFGLTL